MNNTVLGPVLTALATLISPADDPPARFDPSSNYERREIEGWTLLVHRGLLADEALSGPTLELLRAQLFQIPRAVPSPAVEKLRTVKIWVEREEPHHPCMAYHPDPGWLRDHDMNPEKARCVEIANARNFLGWTRQQPWMVLHELAHAYHHQFVEGGFQNTELQEAHKQAVDEGRYGEVMHINGRSRAHYAATNPMEYFAEATEAYFGTNDFFPFVRPELQKHDPRVHDLVARLWGVGGVDR
ncbi:MAG: hypothetical protein U0800_20470 [Isosphaeraceae bacterium]